MTRYAYALALAVAALTAATDGSAEEPATTVIAGITIPATPLSRKAESYVRSQEPDFLFNHSVRTYLFGSLSLKARGLNYDPEQPTSQHFSMTGASSPAMHLRGSRLKSMAPTRPRSS